MIVCESLHLQLRVSDGVGEISQQTLHPISIGPAPTTTHISHLYQSQHLLVLINYKYFQNEHNTWDNALIKNYKSSMQFS